MSDTIRQGFIDPETGEEDIVELPRKVNGWEYDPDHSGGVAVWVHPDKDGVYIGWEKTGGQTYSAWISVPETIPRNTIYDSFATPDESLKRAEEIMETYTPQDVVNKNWK